MGNSEPEPESKPKVEPEENSDNIVVVDPDDYQRTQKLKAIEEAKREYRRYKREKGQILVEFSEYWGSPKEAYNSERAMRIAEYGTELMPLIEAGLEEGVLTEEDIRFGSGNEFKEVNIKEIVRNGGQVPMDGEYKPLPALFGDAVYRQLERIERKLGLGLKLELDKGPAEI